MKLLRVNGEAFEFEIGHQEKVVLLHLLELYPLVPEAHHRLSKGRQIPDQEENQRLLDEALRAQRLANQQQVLDLLNQPGRFVDGAAGYRVGFTRGEIEWLLQVLNDVRIGSWIALGSPGYAEQSEDLPDDQSMRHLMIMEMAGGFETYFLGTVSGDLPPEQN